MAKNAMICLGCGHRALQWLGRCPDCSAWDSFVEQPPMIPTGTKPGGEVGATMLIGSVDPEPCQRIGTGLDELDRVLGGGLVRGSVVLIAGEPGVGKSTLLLQAAAGIEAAGKNVLLVCGEESVEQVAARARRLGAPRRTTLTPETQVHAIVPLMHRADVVLVDSIQSLRAETGGEPGSVSQVRQCAAALTEAARDTGASLVLVGHITKDGSIAGPRALEHLVDVVVTFEGDRGHHLRTVRGIKNRYGATGELGVFQMGPKGLSEVPDASRFFLAERHKEAAGSAVGCIIEGRRSLALEIQALMMSCKPPAVPRRVAQGIESARLGVALAVLQRHCGIKVAECDVYASVAGGLRAAEPAIDLPLCLALASSQRNEPIPPGLAAVGEVGLAGEVRSVPSLPSRVNELFRLGFHTVIAPALHESDAVNDIGAGGGGKVVRAASLSQALATLGQISR